MNQCFLIGNLTKAPENRTTNTGISVTTLSIAVSRRFKRDETDFFTIITWRALADNCARYLVKGQKVAVRGELQTRSYDAKDGTKRYVTEIVADDVEFLQKPGGASAEGGASAPTFNRPAPPQSVPDEDLFASDMNDLMMDDEDMPF